MYWCVADGHGGNGYGIQHMRLRAKINVFQVDKVSYASIPH
jgi:hypothetical protein